MGDKNTRIILYIITITNISHQTNHRLTRQETKFCLNLIYFLEVRNNTGITTRPPQYFLYESERKKAHDDRRSG